MDPALLNTRYAGDGEVHAICVRIYYLLFTGIIAQTAEPIVVPLGGTFGFRYKISINQIMHHSSQMI